MTPSHAHSRAHSAETLSHKYHLFVIIAMSFLNKCKDTVDLNEAVDDALANFSNMSHLPKMPRKQGCTHTKVTRTYGKHKCFHCGKAPAWGWVYRCVQDWERLGIKNIKDMPQAVESAELSSTVSEKPKTATKPFLEKQMISPDGIDLSFFMALVLPYYKPC